MNEYEINAQTLAIIPISENKSNDVQPIIINDEKDETLLQLILPIKTY